MLTFFSKKRTYTFFINIGLLITMKSVSLYAGIPFVSFDYSPNFSSFYESANLTYKDLGISKIERQNFEFEKLANFDASSTKMPSAKLGYLTSSGISFEIDISHIKSDNNESDNFSRFQSHASTLNINVAYYLLNNPLINLYFGIGAGPASLEIKNGISKNLSSEQIEPDNYFYAITSYINANFRSWNYQYFAGGEIKFNESVGMTIIYRQKDITFDISLPDLDSNTNIVQEENLTDIKFLRGELTIHNYKNKIHFVGFGIKIFLDEFKTKNE